MVDISFPFCLMSVMAETTFAAYPLLISYHAGCAMFKMEGAGAKFFGIRPVKTNGIFSYIIFLVPIIFYAFFCRERERSSCNCFCVTWLVDQGGFLL